MITSLLALFFAALVLSALFSGYETGFIQCNRIRIRHLAEEEGVLRAVGLLRHIHAPGRMLTTLLLGNNIVLVVAALAMGGVVRALAEATGAGLSPGMRDLVATLLITPLFLVFGEIIPKSVFRLHPNRLSIYLYPVIRGFYLVMLPLSLPVSWLARAILRAAGSTEESISPLMASLEDLRVLIDESAEHGTIQQEERRMIHSVIDLQTKSAREVMVPRTSIQALPETAPREELLRLFAESGRTRVPVFRESIDEVVGVANAHDVLLDTDPGNPGIRRFVREILHVPDTMKIDDLFDAFKESKQHMAIVIDEYGGTDGLITIEDIIEEIFGDIQDEHDSEESYIHQVGPGAFVIDGRASLGEVSGAVGVELVDDEVDTIGGWIMHIAGRIPLQGEVLQHQGMRLTILGGTSNSLHSIRLEITEEIPREHV
jgi:putative hemolysin